jgi:large subunit ribosomal protein L24
MSNNQNSQRRFRPKYHIKKGDTVLVLSGAEKGKRGVVLYIDTEKGKAIVEGINIITKHRKRTYQNNQMQPGEILRHEAPVYVCKLMLIDPSTDEPTRTGKRLEDGRKVRYSKKSQATIV